MWCVADLNEDYIAKMEDVLERMNNHTIPKGRWCAWMRNPSRCMPTSAPARQPNRVGGKTR
jgi:hypothetical protein